MLVTIARFSFPHEAHLAKARLDALGIPSFIADEYTINMQWLYSDAMGGVRLQVPGEFAAEAQAALAETDDDPLNDESDVSGAKADEDAEVAAAPAADAAHAAASAHETMVAASRCPRCGGLLGAPAPAGKRPAILSWLFLGFPIWPVRRLRRCMVCGKTVRA